MEVNTYYLDVRHRNGMKVNKGKGMEVSTEVRHRNGSEYLLLGRKAQEWSLFSHHCVLQTTNHPRPFLAPPLHLPS